MTRAPLVAVLTVLSLCLPATALPSPGPRAATNATLSGAEEAGVDLGEWLPAPDCPTGALCRTFTVSCPGIDEDATGTLSWRRPLNAHGLVVLHAGGGGGKYWASTPEAEAAVEALNAHGLATVQVAWDTGWLWAPEGQPLGPITLACRPNTMIHWVHENLYPLIDETTSSGAGPCGFCYTGNSAGAAAAAYSMTFHSLDWLDAAVLSSGPPFADLEAACLQDPERRGLWMDDGGRSQLDNLYGYERGGPCIAGDPSWRSTWQDHSLGRPGGDHDHEARMTLLAGGADDTAAVAHMDHYRGLLRAGGTDVDWTTVPGMGHMIQESPHALALLVASLTTDQLAPPQRSANG